MTGIANGAVLGGGGDLTRAVESKLEGVIMKQNKCVSVSVMYMNFQRKIGYGKQHKKLMIKCDLRNK